MAASSITMMGSLPPNSSTWRLYTAFAAMYDRLANDPHLYAKIFPLEGDPRSEMSQAEFMAHAWGLANRKARELGWVV